MARVGDRGHFPLLTKEDTSNTLPGFARGTVIGHPAGDPELLVVEADRGGYQWTIPTDEFIVTEHAVRAHPRQGTRGVRRHGRKRREQRMLRDIVDFEGY